MLRFALGRIGLALVQLALVLAAAFAITALLPGDAAVVVAGESATPEAVETIRRRLGLDQPLLDRAGHWFGGLANGDLGRSLVTGVPVAEEVGERFTATAILTGGTLLVLVPLALVLGVSCGLREGSRADRALNLVTVALHAVPEFVLGLLLLSVFSVSLGLLPATAAGLAGGDLISQPTVLVLPIAVLVSRQLCDLSRQVRIGVADHTAGELAAHLRLLGMSERTVLLRHVLPAAAAPVTQQLARTVEWLLGGAVIVESLFAIRGLGSGFVEAVQNRDIPAVQGYVVVFTTVIVLVNLLADLLAHRINPRLEVVGR